MSGRGRGGKGKRGTEGERGRGGKGERGKEMREGKGRCKGVRGKGSQCHANIETSRLSVRQDSFFNYLHVLMGDDNEGRKKQGIIYLRLTTINARRWLLASQLASFPPEQR